MSTISLLFKGQNGKCFYCRGRTWIPFVGWRKRQFSETVEQAKLRLGIRHFHGWAPSKILKFSLATVEHLVRVTDGGKRADGIVMACAFCNSTRHGATVEEHQAAMAWDVMRGRHPVNRSASMQVASTGIENAPQLSAPTS